MSTTRPTPAAMPTAAHGLARTCVSSSAPTPPKCSRALRSDSSARARTSRMRGPTWSAVADSSSSASTITALRSSIRSLPADSMRFSADFMRLSLENVRSSYCQRHRLACIRQVAGDRLQQVFACDDALERAARVDDERHLRRLALEEVEGVEHRRRLAHRQALA